MRRAALWTEREAAAATGGHASAPFAATGVSIDSRTIEPGDVFVALRGPHRDGHDHIAEAVKRGAAALLVDHEPGNAATDTPLVIVKDTLRGLEALGVAARARSRARVIAVTGSVGKTGTKDALKLVLSVRNEAHASAASYNNQWGVPLSLARMPRDARHAIFEIGMNHAGEIAPLVRLVRPHIAIITNVEAAHLEFFDSVEAIANAKAEIFEGVEPDGVAILNRDNLHYARLASAARAHGIGRVVGFGENSSAWVRLVGFALHADCSCVSASVGGVVVSYRIGVAGRHWVHNSLAVLAAVGVLDADLGAATRALVDLKAQKGRGQHHLVQTPEGAFEVIDDSYNANPASMRAAFEVLGAASPGAGGLRLAVLGDMRELGPESDRLHRDLVPALVAAKVDLVFSAGTHMAALHHALPANLRGHHADTAATLVPAVVEAVRPGDVVVIKGSLTTGMATIVEALLDLHEPARAVNGN